MEKKISELAVLTARLEELQRQVKIYLDLIAEKLSEIVKEKQTFLRDWKER